MKKALYDMVYLCACAVNGIAADAQRCAEMDPEKLFTVCERHSLSVAVLPSASSNSYSKALLTFTEPPERITVFSLGIME